MSGRLDTVLRWVIALTLLGAATIVWRSAGLFGQGLLAEIAAFAIFAMGIDLLAGGIGLMSIGQAAYFGLGAYATAVFTTHYEVGAGTAMLLSIAMATALAVPIGLLIVRFGEVIFILLTLAVGEMVYSFVFANQWLGGSDGISGVGRLDLSAIGLDLSAPSTFSAVVIVVAFAVFAVLDTVKRSPFGAVLAAVRQNPVRARALGAPLTRLRLTVYCAAAALAALAGSFMGQLNGFVSPDLAGWMLSGLVLIMVIFGGLGSISGAALGAVLVKLASQYLAELTSYWNLILGVAFIAVVLFAENGVFALLRRAALWAALWAGASGRGSAGEALAARAEGALSPAAEVRIADLP